MFKFWASQEQQAQPRPQEVSSQSWYPPPAVSYPNSSRPGTPGQSSPHVSPSEAAGIISSLRGKSVDELRKLLSDKEAYHHFLFSLEQVTTQNNIKDDLRRETLQLAGENLEKEPRIMELRNQCRIIRTTELAGAQEKLNELENQKEEILKLCSPGSLVDRLQESINKTDEESETLHRQLLDKEIDLGTFVQNYKKLRITYQRQTLIQLSTRTSTMG